MNILFADKTMIPLPPQAAKALKEREAKEKGMLWLEEVSDINNDELFSDYNTWAHVYEAAAKPVSFPTKVVATTMPSVASCEAQIPNKLSHNDGDDDGTRSADCGDHDAGGGGDEKAVSPQQHRTTAPATTTTGTTTTTTTRANLFGQTPHLLAAQFEKSQKAKLKARVIESKHESVNTLRSGLSAKLVLMAMDTSCHLLQNLEDSLENNNYERPFVNAIRALVLTFRFEKPNMRRKIFHLRHVICARLVDLLDLKLRDQTLLETQLACREGLTKMETDMLLDREWNAWMERFVRIESPDDSDSRVTAPHVVPDEAVLAITGLMPPIVFQEESAISIRKESLELIKGFVKSKMKGMHTALAYAIDQLLMEFAVAKFVPDTAKPALPLREEMVNIVENIHERLLQTVTQDVSGIVDLLGDLMSLK